MYISAPWSRSARHSTLQSEATCSTWHYPRKVLPSFLHRHQKISSITQVFKPKISGVLRTSAFPCRRCQSRGSSLPTHPMSSVLSHVILIAVIVFWSLTFEASAFLLHGPSLRDSDSMTKTTAAHLDPDTGEIPSSKTKAGITLNGQHRAIKVCGLEQDRLKKLWARLGLDSHRSRASLDDDTDATSKRAADTASNSSSRSLPCMTSDDKTLAHHEHGDQRNKGSWPGKRNSKQRLNSDGGQFSGSPVSSG